MATPNIQLNISANVAGQAQVQALSQALQQLRTTASSVSSSSGSSPFASIVGGASEAAGSVSDLANSIVGSAASMAAGFLSAKVAAEAFFDAFKTGIDYNAGIETATVGVQTLINAFYTAKDAAGNIASAQQQLQMSGAEAQRQIQLLQQASLSTAASFETLYKSFQHALAGGASAGMTIDQVRQITVLVTQAAGAVGLPLTTLNRDINDLFNGSKNTNTILQRTLGITGQQLVQWREQGTLAENLTAKLQAFAATGEIAGQTWSATMTHIGTAFSMVMGQMSSGAFDGLKTTIQDALKEAFDPKNGGLSEQFSNIEKTGESVFGGLGSLLSDGIKAAVEGAKEFNTWLGQNHDAVSRIEEAFSLVVSSVGTVIKSIAAGLVDLADWGVKSGAFESVLEGIALTCGAIEDGFKAIEMVIDRIGAALTDTIGQKMKTWLGQVATARLGAGEVSDKIATIASNLYNAIPNSGQGMAAQAARIAQDFANGNTAVNKIKQQIAAIHSSNATADDQEMQRLKNRQKTTSGLDGGTLTPNPGNKEDNSKALAKIQQAYEAIAKAKLAAAKQVADAERAERQTELDEELQDQKLSYMAYVQQKAALQKDAIAKELAAAQDEKAAIEGRQAADQAASLKKQADLIKIKGTIDALTTKQHQVDIQVEIDTTKAQRELQAFETSVKAALLNSQGKSTEANRITIEQQRVTQLQDPKVSQNPQLQSEINQTSANSQTRNDFSGEQEELQQRNNLYKDYDTALQQQQDAGLLTSQEHETLMQAERAKVIAQEQTIVDAMVANAAALGDPKLMEQAQQAQLALNALKLTTDSTATAINQSFVKSIPQGLEDLVSRTKSVGDVLKDLLLSIVQTWEQIAAKDLSESLLKSLGGNNGGIGGLLSKLLGGGVSSSSGSGGSSSSLGSYISSGWNALENFFGGFFAEGGIINGPGTGTSDSIPAMLSNGEGVVTAAAVQGWGADFIHFLNKNPQGLATGGIAGGLTSDRVSSAMSAVRSSPSSSASSPVNLRVVNSVDPSMMRNSLDSSEGETIIENVLSRNPSRFKAALRLK